MHVKVSAAAVLTLSLLVLVHCRSSQLLITLYKDIHHVDMIGEMEVVGCRNLEDWQNDQVSSVNTHSRCFELYEHGNCEGRVVRVGPKGENGCPDHGDLRSCNFNDILSSIHPCH